MKLGEQGSIRTGIDVLDRKLGDGIPTGTVTVLAANPASQSELFLYEVAALRRTVYLSTIRSRGAIETVLEARDLDTDRVEPIRIEDGEPLDHAQALLEDLPDGVNVIVDPVDVLEASGGASYRRFLADVKEQVTDTRSAVFLHCLSGDETPAGRRDTLHVADLVFELSTEVSGDSVVNRLTVPKFRNGQSIEEVIKLDLTSEIEVDLSRNIL